MGCPANAYMAWHYRHEANWRIWLPTALMMLIGIIPGVFLLKNIDARMMKLIFGALVVLVGLEMATRERGGKIKKNSRPVMFVISILSGILCGLFGIGALLAAYFSRTTDNSQSFKGSMGIVFFIENIFRIVLYSVSGVFTIQIIQRAFMLLPLMALGFFLGMKSIGHISEKGAKRIVIVMLILSGMALIMTNLR